VLQVINNLTMGGAEGQLKEQTLGLRKRGLMNEVYLLRRTGSYFERSLEDAGVPLYGPRSLSVYSPLQVLALARHLCNHAYDLIHVHLFPAQLWAVLASGLVGVQTSLLTTEHSTHNRRRRWFFRPVDRWLYTRYQGIVCVSEATQSALTQWIPGTMTKTRVIPNGVKLDRFVNAVRLPRQKIFGVSEGTPLILTVGRLEPQKDHATLIRALQHLDGVSLAIVGDGSLREGLEALVRELGLTKRVYFLGWRTDIPQLLKAADVYVQSSHWEGFGIAAVEAMAAGLPVVASRVPGLADVVGDAGVLCAPGSVADMVNSLQVLLGDPERRGELSRLGSERAGKYSIERTLDLYMGVYGAITGCSTSFTDHD